MPSVASWLRPLVTPGTKVDKQLIYLRVLDDFDEPHIRLLRLMTTKPPHQDALNQQMEAIGRSPVRQWHPSDLAGVLSLKFVCASGAGRTQVIVLRDLEGAKFPSLLCLA